MTSIETSAFTLEVGMSIFHQWVDHPSEERHRAVMRFKVLLTDLAWSDLDLERSILSDARAEPTVAPASDEASLVQAAADADAIMTTWARVTGAVIAAAPRLRIVARLGIGLDNIDVAHASRRGILVTNVPDYCLTEVAEHALALVLALGRNVAFYHQQTKSGVYQLNAGPKLRRLAGQTLGIVGLGKTGRTLAEKARSIGLRVLATSRNRVGLPPGVEWRELDALLVESDFVSLHVPSTPATRHLVGARELALMKPTAFLINTARGALVDESALAAALAANRLAGAALDVQESEPPNLGQALFSDPRVIVTPHVAFMSAESLAELRSRAARQVADALLGRIPDHVVNPEALTARQGPHR